MTYTLQNYAQDSFSNTKTSGWNPSSGGQTWAQQSGASTPTIITAASQKRGQLSGDTAANVFWLGTNQFTDTDLYVRVLVSNTAVTVGLVSRATGATKDYRLSVTGSTLSLIKDNTSATSLKTATVTFAASTYYWLHLRIRGFGDNPNDNNNVKGNFWADPNAGAGSTPSGEPAGWMVQVADTTFTSPGNFGLFYQATASGQSATFDNFTVTDNPPPATVPAYNTLAAGPYGNTWFTAKTPPPLPAQLITDMVGPNSVSSTGWKTSTTSPTLRDQLQWGPIEPYQGFYDWGVMDDHVQKCNYSGIRFWFAFDNAPSWRLTLDAFGSNATLNGTYTHGTAYTNLSISALPAGAYLPHGYQIQVGWGLASAETVFIWNPNHTYTAGATSIGISTSKSSQVGWNPVNTHSPGEPVREATQATGQLVATADMVAFATLVATRYNGQTGFGTVENYQVYNENADIQQRVQGQGSYNTSGGSPASWDMSSTWDNGGAILAPTYVAVQQAIAAVPGCAATPVFACAVRKTAVTGRAHIQNWMTGLVSQVAASGGTLLGVDFHYYRDGTTTVNPDGTVTLQQDPTKSTFADAAQSQINAPSVAQELLDLQAIFAANSINPLLSCAEFGWSIYDDGGGALTTTTATYSAGTAYSSLAVSSAYTHPASISDGTPIFVDYSNTGVTEKVYAYGTIAKNATTLPITTNPLGSQNGTVAVSPWTPASTHASGIQVYAQTTQTPVSTAVQSTYSKAMLDALRAGGATYGFIFTDNAQFNTVTTTTNPAQSQAVKSVTQTIGGVFTFEPTYGMICAYAQQYPTWTSSSGGTGSGGGGSGTPGTFIPYATGILKDGPQAYYRMDEASGNAHDSSGNNNTATCTGITYSQAGALAGDSDTAYLFNGTSSHLVCSSGPSPVGWNKLTLEAWVKLANNTFSHKATLWATGTTPTNSGDGIDFWIGAGGSGGGCAVGVEGDRWGQATFSQTFQAGVWYYVAATWDGTTITLYVNGQANGTTGKVTGQIDDTGSTLSLGYDPQKGSDFFPGTLDECAIYAKGLSATAVQSHYAYGLALVAATPTPPVITQTPGPVFLLINDVLYPTLLQESISVERTASDPIPTFSFTLQDDPSHIPLSELQEVVFVDAGQIPEPTHNLLLNPALNPYTTAWSARAAQTGISYSQSSGGGGKITFANAANGNVGYLTQTTQNGMIVAGQSYMLSATVQGASPVNLSASLRVFLLDQYGNQLSSVRFDGPTPVSATATRYSVQVSVPAGAAALQAQLLATATGATNSGSVTFTQAMLEPMTFAQGKNYQLAYPTPWCAAGQENCVALPNGTAIRQLRLFGGVITKATAGAHIGPNRQWAVTVSGYAWLLQKQILNDTWTNQSDSSIITSIVSKYFSGVFSTANVASTNGFQNTLSYQYNGTARDAFDALATNSNYIYGVDSYWTIFYQPPGYNTLNFELSDTPDDIVSFAYYDYTRDIDGTQLGNAIYVTGASGIAAIVIDAQSVAIYSQRLGSSGMFWRQVNNSALASVQAAIDAGIGEAGEYGYSRPIIHLSTNQFMTPGYTVYFTSRTDSFFRVSFIIQKVTLVLKGFISLGQALYECQCDLGAFNPELTNILTTLLRMQVSSTTGGGSTASYYGPVTAPAPSIDLMATETVNFRDSVAVTVTGTTGIGGIPAAAYGSAQATYGSPLVGYQ